MYYKAFFSHHGQISNIYFKKELLVASIQKKAGNFNFEQMHTRYA